MIQDLPEQSDVGNGQPQGVNLGESLLIRECWHVDTELLESSVDTASTVWQRKKSPVLAVRFSNASN